MTKRQPEVALANKAENYLLYKQDRVPRTRATDKDGACIDFSSRS